MIGLPISIVFIIMECGGIELVIGGLEPITRYFNIGINIR